MSQIKLINFKILDGIRGIAALYVVINHCRGNLLIGGSELAKTIPVADWSIWTKLYYGSLQFTSLGREFVVVFFVLSGFSIAHSLKSNQNILTFYKKRLIRLYLPYILALIFAYVVFELTYTVLQIEGNSVFGTTKNVISNLFYIPKGQMIPQFWSLSHEVLFYIIAPLILISNKKINWYYIISIAIYIGSIAYSTLNLSGDTIITKFILDYNIYFAIGIYLYKNISKITSYWIFNKKIYFYIISIILVTAMVVIKFKLGEYNKISSGLSAIFSITLIVFFLKFKLSNKILQFFGEISYTLYITHFASIYLVSYLLIKLNIIESQITSNPYVWILGVLFSVIIAVPFYYLGEKPTKVYLKKIRRKFL